MTTGRGPAIAGYALGFFLAMAGWVLWTELVSGSSGKAGWGWGLALALPIALLPTATFALALRLGANHGLALRRTSAVAIAALGGALTPALVLLARDAARVTGVGTDLFTGLLGGLLVLLPVGAWGAALAIRWRVRSA